MINAMNNPHIAYDFNLHAPDERHIARDWLFDLDHLNICIDKRQVYEYYFMTHIHTRIFSLKITKIFSTKSGDTTLNLLFGICKMAAEWTPDKHEKIVNALSSFVASVPRMDYTAYGGEFTGGKSSEKNDCSYSRWWPWNADFRSTHLKPKPMIEVGGKPMLWHIMKIYGQHGINEFIICCGYKGYVIKEYFELFSPYVRCHF